LNSDSQNMSKTDEDGEITPIMKRDAVAGVLTQPDGVDWYRFIENTENDGFEDVTIPSDVSPAEDWRFYVRHMDSDAYDASDETFTFVAESPHLLGDVNGDGEVTPGDAVAACELSKKFEWTAEEPEAADFNGDGEITPKDAVSIYEKSKEF